MKIIITGASGFIGTNLLEFYLGKADVINIDCRAPKNRKHLQYWKNVDCLDKDAIFRAFVSFDPDYIIHLAARTDIWGESLEDYGANVTGVKNVLAASSACKNLKKILITSSMLVCKAGYMPLHQKDYNPTTWYGKSKVETENITWANKPFCDWAILRPTSIWGPWFGTPYRNFFDMVRSRRYFHIGHKACTKTYGYIENAVYQIDRILKTDTTNENNKVFYLGDDPATNIEEWANQIATELGFRIPRLPYWLVRGVAWGGDILTKLKIPFPMYSFRLKNMTTDNIINLYATNKIAPSLPVDRTTGIKRTLDWLKDCPNC